MAPESVTGDHSNRAGCRAVPCRGPDDFAEGGAQHHRTDPGRFPGHLGRDRPRGARPDLQAVRRRTGPEHTDLRGVVPGRWIGLRNVPRHRRHRACGQREGRRSRDPLYGGRLQRPAERYRGCGRELAGGTLRTPERLLAGGRAAPVRPRGAGTGRRHRDPWWHHLPVPGREEEHHGRGTRQPGRGLPGHRRADRTCHGVPQRAGEPAQLLPGPMAERRARQC